MEDTAYLYNEGRYTVFEFGNTRLKFIGPYTLERYCQITTWDQGYIEVLTKYSGSPEPEEEYIDLVPVLESLYMNPDTYLSPIKKLEVKNVQC